MRVSANTQGIFTRAREQAEKINSPGNSVCFCLSHHPPPGEWAPFPPLLQAAGWAKVTLSHPKSWCRAKTQLRAVLTGAVSPLSTREGRSPLVTVTPPACHAAASQARTVFFLQSPLGPGSNLEASAPNHPGLQELKKKKPIRGPGSCKHKSV